MKLAAMIARRKRRDAVADDAMPPINALAASMLACIDSEVPSFAASGQGSKRSAR